MVHAHIQPKVITIGMAIQTNIHMEVWRYKNDFIDYMYGEFAQADPNNRSCTQFTSARKVFDQLMIAISNMICYLFIV